ncbi:hypothetical protein L1987_77613 [Smallanthus sonchifolius]|uniref:Uncharacterized protein n=1 Tax=Smallanthus sonchifolius TaxID=185202 RepID=A0ACB8ZEW6_9ASTR|nr:hypothetical protein L1987_77613 [Smallanthus sonchifolius]
MSIDFKDNETPISVIQNQNHNHNYSMDSGSESAFIGSWSSSSSSSFLTTSFGSELDSNDADLDDGDGDDEDEFIAQLTRRMADYMLEENDEAGGDENRSLKHSSFQKRDFQEPILNKNHEQTLRSYADTVKKSIAGFQSEQSLSRSEHEQSQPPIQLNQVENQPRAGRGRKGKMSESTQHMKAHRHEQMHSNRSFRGGKEFVNGGKSMTVGSGMRAIFLGGSGSRNVMSGTGVFLPRSSTDATDHSRKKPGCSTVLVPTRVLQALEQHFNNIESLSSSNKLAQTPHVSKEKTQTQESVSVDHQDSRLPQDWIY